MYILKVINKKYLFECKYWC